MGRTSGFGGRGSRRKCERFGAGRRKLGVGLRAERAGVSVLGDGLQPVLPTDPAPPSRLEPPVLAPGLTHRAKTDVSGKSTAVAREIELRKASLSPSRLEALSALELGVDQLAEVRSALRARIRKGLAVEGSEIAALPAFVGAPDASLRGEALVLDTGGTNMRAARVRLGGERGAELVDGPVQRLVPGREESITRAAFFGAHRDLVGELEDAAGLPVGYCFSFGSEILPDGDARLLRWSKGIHVPDVEGTRVGAALHDALTDGGLAPGRVSVLNDTVAALLGGAAAYACDGFADFIGLIAGTGHNIASFVDPESMPKLGDSKWTGRMAVNLETGNFSPPHLTKWDVAVDAAMDNAGFHRFEKAVSGYYLPFIFQQIVPELEGFDPEAGSRVLAELRDDPSQTALVRRAAALLLDRSADLVAASLAAVADVSSAKEGTIGILAEGGLFWRIPGYAARVEHTLCALLAGGPVNVRILKLDDANLYGAASAALMRSR